MKKRPYTFYWYAGYNPIDHMRLVQLPWNFALTVYFCDKIWSNRPNTFECDVVIRTDYVRPPLCWSQMNFVSTLLTIIQYGSNKIHTNQSLDQQKGHLGATSHIFIIMVDMTSANYYVTTLYFVFIWYKLKIFRKKYREPWKHILVEFSSDTLAASETMESKIEKCMDIGTVLFSLLLFPGRIAWLELN